MIVEKEYFIKGTEEPANYEKKTTEKNIIVLTSTHLGKFHNTKGNEKGYIIVDVDDYKKKSSYSRKVGYVSIQDKK